ncbi:patatin-like phospholipase family protein [Acidovorax sp.]|uniref:patatin-like phospholipase family protein n=1 Tax=Acidovorax sp. TaxID=1872122 RepID=UPI00391F3782
MSKTTRRAPAGRVRLNLALQGGGTQGAFTWGVLDRLLEEEHIDIGSISGTSAGALNGAALATGMARGGRSSAKEHLSMLWEQLAQAGSLMTFLLLPMRKPGMGIWDDALPILSPYQTNPVGMAPLRYILNTVVDETLLRDTSAAPRLFVNALHVQSGSGRVFEPEEMSIEAILASACAPLSYQAIEIDGESYWDGSYAANPSLWPLYESQLDTDILLVELTPLHRAETPLSAKNILNRINEAASINGLVSELRSLELINRTVPEDDIRMHVLSLPDRPAGLLATEPSIKRTVGRVLFEMLRQDGRQACDAWLESTVDISARYLRPYTQQPDMELSSTAP